MLVYNADLRMRIVNIREKPGFVVCHCHPEALERTAALFIQLTAGVSHAVDGNRTL